MACETGQMTARWGAVLAGVGVPLTTKVGGISLAMRHVRSGHRIGWLGITFVIPDEQERRLVKESFVRFPAPEGFKLDFVASEDELAAKVTVSVEASGIYKRERLVPDSDAPTKIAPDFRISDKSDIKAATAFLYTQIRKSIEMDGVIAFYVMRPMARLFTRALLNTSVSPNQATLGALACGIAAAIFAALGSPLYAIFAGLLYWFGGVIDCIDGELARLRMQSSKFGEWLDSMVDEFSTLALIVGIGIGLTRDGYGDHWQYLAFAGAVVATFTLGRMYLHLHRNKLMIDTAQFPWFYINPEGPTQSSSLIGKLIEFVGYFVRRDANLTIISLLLIINLRVAALCTMLVAFAAVTGLLLAHYLIISARKA